MWRPLQSNAAAQEPSAVSASGAAGPDQAGSGAAPGWERASQAIDAVRARFGEAAVGPATSLGEKRRAPSQYDRSPSSRTAKLGGPLRGRICRNLWPQRAVAGPALGYRFHV